MRAEEAIAILEFTVFIHRDLTKNKREGDSQGREGGTGSPRGRVPR